MQICYQSCFNNFKSAFQILKYYWPVFNAVCRRNLQRCKEITNGIRELQCDSILKQKYSDVKISKLHSFLSRERFPKLLAAIAKIIAMFESTVYTYVNNFFH